MSVFGKLSIILLICTVSWCGACNYGSVESDSFVEDGIKKLKANNLDEATALFIKALESNPNNDVALYQMALIDMKYRDYSRAKANLERAMGIAPDKVEYRFTLGLVHKGDAEKLAEAKQFNASVGEYNACARVFKKTVKMDPYYAGAHLEQARCELNAKSYLAAVEAYQKAIEANPYLKSKTGEVEHYKELGLLYSNFGFYDEARMVLNNGIINNGGDPSLEIALAGVLRHMKQYEEALAHYELAEKSASARGNAPYTVLSAMYGAGVVSFELARIDEKNRRQRQAFDKYASSRAWLEKYIQNATSESEHIRRSGAVLLVREINALLAHDVI